MSHHAKAKPTASRPYLYLLAFSVMLIGSAVIAPMLYTWRTQGDYSVHLDYTLRLLGGDWAGVLPVVPNVLYHVSAFVPYYLSEGLGVVDALVIGNVPWYALLLLVTFLWLRRYEGRALLLVGLVSLALLIVAPLSFITPENLYFGYLTPNVYHNPTMIPLRPTSLLLFIAALASFSQAPVGWWRWARVPLVALLTVACILAKPSYLMILLPALALVTLFRIVRRQPIDWLLLLGGIVIPAGALLGVQALIFTRGAIAWEPGRTFWEWSLHYEPNANHALLLKWALSVAFPIAVYALYWRTAWRSLMLNLAWLCFVIGLAYAYLLVDTGEVAAGNLVWNAQIGTFVLFVASAAHWLRAWRVRSDWRDWRRLWSFVACSGFLLLHTVAGVHWYLLHLNSEFIDLIYIWW